MIYFIITTCLIKSENFNERKNKYKESLDMVKKLLGNKKNIKIIIVENTGKKHRTFLNDYGFDVYYTENNHKYKTNNKGAKELKDIWDCIEKYNIKDEDFVIKMTGRYILNKDSDFVNEIINYKNQDCILRYGSFFKPVNERVVDCITGLIGMKAKHVKNINMKAGYKIKGYPMEWEWARVTLKINHKKIKIMNKLGILISPVICRGRYFEV